MRYCCVFNPKLDYIMEYCKDRLEKAVLECLEYGEPFSETIDNLDLLFEEVN